MSDASSLRVVVYQEDEQWIAQCVDYDIGAQGTSFDDMSVKFALTLRADFEESMSRHGEAFSGIDPAPAHFEKMWESRPADVQSVRPTDGGMPTFDMALVA